MEKNEDYFDDEPAYNDNIPKRPKRIYINNDEFDKIKKAGKVKKVAEKNVDDYFEEEDNPVNPVYKGNPIHKEFKLNRRFISALCFFIITILIAVFIIDTVNFADGIKNNNESIESAQKTLENTIKTLQDLGISISQNSDVYAAQKQLEAAKEKAKEVKGKLITSYIFNMLWKVLVTCGLVYVAVCLRAKETKNKENNQN